MSGRSPLILVSAGGTGGHVYPALAVAAELIHRGYRVEWIGARAGLENRVVPAAGIPLYRLPVRGVRGKSALHKLIALAVLGVSVMRALWLMLRLRPVAVIGMGGYAAGPAGIAAWMLRRPLLIHEQNAVAGTTNRMLRRFARRVLAGFPGAFGAGQDVTVVGNPLRRELLQLAAEETYTYDGSRPLRVLVLGGSLGAAPLNKVMPGAVQRLFRDHPGAFQFRHQTGETHIAAVRARYGDLLGEALTVVPFIEDMAEAYSWADLVLCRAGALTVSELALMGRPAILVPLPQAIDDHQSANARVLSDCGGAVTLSQSQLDAYKLARVLATFRDRPEQLQAMARAAAGAAAPGAAQRVCDFCEDLLHG